MYLNNHLIGSTPLKTEKIIEFNFVDGNVLKIQEDNVAILEFISFEVLYCASNPGNQKVKEYKKIFWLARLFYSLAV